MRRFIDPFIVALLAMLAIGLLVPIPDVVRAALDIAADIAIVVLFFLYGARLATHEVVAGLRNVRLQGATLATTFVLFPLLGLALSTLAAPVLGESLAQGVLYLSLLPSTVQSCVALTSVARGNVAGTLTAATVSNLLGMVVTPLLVLVLMHTGGSAGGGGIRSVLLLLLLPFVIGQLVQPLIGGYVRSRKRLTSLWDRGTILLVVLVAVSTATASGVWGTVSAPALIAVIAACALLLAAALAATWWGGRLLRLSTEDRISLLMAGSQKSLATGLPMLAALFPAALAGPIAVPVIVFHQLQLIVSTVIARRLSRRA
ncbi:bile acid:sodium symporter family protein [Pseudactinotalea sp.]|uniref:bile acid:sodium symporter family protein n=1 Tax=Pseudactinotalea sp. TaxID=1926260 RepID=UPI003B3BA505